MPTRTPDEREALLTRVRAAKTLAASRPGNQEELEMQAFLAIFHPDVSPDSEVHRTLVQSARDSDARRRR